MGKTPDAIVPPDTKCPAPVDYRERARRSMGHAWAAVLGGTLHGLAELPLVVPIEASITQTQLNGKTFIWNFKDLWRQRALYRSFNTTAVGLIPKCWIHYAWLNFYIQMIVPTGDMRDATKMQSVACGMLTGASEVLFLNPFNFVKFRMQRPEWAYKNMLDCIVTVSKVEGPSAFWKGTQAVFFRNSICMFGMVGCYNTVEQALPEKTPFRRLTAGACCGIIGSFLSYPFEMLRAARQHNVSFKDEMWNKGFGRLMAGYLPGAARIVLHSAALGIIMPEMTKMAKGASWFTDLPKRFGFKGKEEKKEEKKDE